MVRVMPIIRSRSGCFTCRRRKKKCNEKPVCSGCRRKKLECHWPDLSSAGFYRSSAVDLGSQPSSDAGADGSDDAVGSPAISLSSAAAPTCLDSLSQRGHDNEATNQLSASQVRALCRQVGSSLRPLSLLPSHGHNSYELLSHYLSRTANSMGNGSTDVNPFIAKLVPLTFSNPLVLQLILAQSAAHRQASTSLRTGNEIAQQYYTDSLRMFRNVVGEYVAGKEEDHLTLTVGSLILCLTEVVRGDVFGTIFDHLAASRSLLTLLDRPESQALLGGLADFLVEYYMHTAASSIISTDPHGSWQSRLSPSIERMARALVARRYMGQLCGCWLELLLLIPQVFELGKTMLPPAESTPRPPAAEDIITFGFLQSKIFAFIPSATASPYSQLAGLLFKQATLLYLWTILGPLPPSSCGAHSDLVRGTVAEAVSLLGRFPASVRVNTTLCWPLAVIGCCTADPGVQDVLRARLQTMIDSIGLGNMRATLVLLERIWRQPEATSPWLLHKAMQEHQIWISFA